MQRDGRIDTRQRAGQADAANEQLGEVKIIAEADRRNQILERFDTGGVGPRQRIAAHCGNRQRNVRQCLFALLRGYQDCVAVVFRCGILCLGRCGQQQAGSNGAQPGFREKPRLTCKLAHNFAPACADRGFARTRGSPPNFVVALINPQRLAGRTGGAIGSKQSERKRLRVVFKMSRLAGCLGANGDPA